MAAYSTNTWAMGRRAVDALDFVFASGFAVASTTSLTSVLEREGGKVEGDGRTLRCSGGLRGTHVFTPRAHSVTIGKLHLTGLALCPTLVNMTLELLSTVAPFSCV